MAKVIRTNDVQIEANPKLPNVKNARELVKDLVKIEDEHLQYVKPEKEGNLIGCNMHPFVEAVHLAYGQHLPLVISPDMIWYLISSGIAKYINQHAEEVRNKFVDHEGKKVIKVRRDDFVLGSLKNPWHEVIDEFCMKVDKLTKNDVATTIQANFSTTTKDARVVSQIVLMDAMQKYFDYRFCTMCGIPEIRVTGTRDDWVNVLQKTNKMVALIPELKRWLDAGLDEILKNFISVFDNKIEKDFWNQIYKVNGGSGGPYITGWIVALFPYISDNQPNRYIWNDKASWKDTLKRSAFGGLTTSSFDYHMNQVPFTWEYYGSEIKMLFLGGILGVSVAKEDNALMPVFGYAIGENKIKTGENNFKYEEQPDMN